MRSVLACAALAVACNSGAAAPPPPPATGAPAAPAPKRAMARDAGVDADLGTLAGKPLFAALCAPCHGAKAQGYAADHAPSLVTRTFLESATDDFLRRSILAGRPGTSMPAYGKERGGPLDDAAIDRLVAFLRAQGPAARPLRPVSPGSASTGAAIYAQRCRLCHGDRSSRGEAISLANPELLAAASDAFLRHAIVHGRPGTKMEAFAGTLTDAEIDGVVAYVRGFAQGERPPAMLPEPTGKEPLVQNPGGANPTFTLRADPCPPAAPGGSLVPCIPDARFVSVEQVGKALAAKQRMVIVDARPASDWRRVHIAGAVSIPYHALSRLDELPKDAWIIAYCACPHHLSGIVVDELRKRGYTRAVVLDEGINEWHRRGLPVVAADGVATPLPEPKPATR